MTANLYFLLGAALQAALICSTLSAKCSSCETLVSGVGKQMMATKGKSSGAGNTAWEESRGIKYDTSEARLFEILENVCEKSDHFCNEVLSDGEEYIETWWNRRKAGTEFNRSQLFSYLCVKKVKLCCDDGYYGKKCSECPGGAKSPCSDHGRCDGSGDRKGKGKCQCDVGYIGKRCAKCATDHYKSAVASPDKSALPYTCNRCDESCAKSCSGPGNTKCKACAKGYNNNTETGACDDIDECRQEATEGVEGGHSCVQNKYCVNTPGSYKCEDCDKACHPDDGCIGPGPTNCSENSCADGYTFTEDSGCADVNECEEENMCNKDQYCENVEGSFKCHDCSKACDPEGGCVNGKPIGCKLCAHGYIRPQGKDIGCEDIDECEQAGTCDESMVCANTEGSFSCECSEFKEMVDGKCVDKQEDTDGVKDEL